MTLRFTTTATLHRWTEGRDELNDVVAVFVDDPDPLPCELQQQWRRSVESTDNSDKAESMWFGIFPATASLDFRDEFTVPRLGRFGFIGDPWLVDNARTGVPSHWEGKVRQVK